MEEFTEKKHWDKVNNKFYYSISKENPITTLMRKYIPDAQSEGECFEIGCCPCPYLSWVGLNKKYKINGIDYSDGVDKRLIEWLKKLPIQIGSIEKADFFKYKGEKKFDFVYSLGFIEHFGNYKKVIAMHDKYVKKGGYLMITTPNFRGKLQFILHKLLDRKNLEMHNIYSMNPEKWKELLEGRYEIIYYGYFGGFDFWAEDEQKGTVKLCLSKFVEVIVDKCKGENVRNSSLYSPYCGIIARKL